MGVVVGSNVRNYQSTGTCRRRLRIPCERCQHSSAVQGADSTEPGNVDLSPTLFGDSSHNQGYLASEILIFAASSSLANGLPMICVSLTSTSAARSA